MNESWNIAFALCVCIVSPNRLLTYTHLNRNEMKLNIKSLNFIGGEYSFVLWQFHFGCCFQVTRKSFIRQTHASQLYAHYRFNCFSMCHSVTQCEYRNWKYCMQKMETKIKWQKNEKLYATTIANREREGSTPPNNTVYGLVYGRVGPQALVINLFGKNWLWNG